MRKSLYIFTLLLMTLCTGANAQVESPRSILEIGVAGGMNLSRMEFQPSIRQKLQQGANGGIYARYTSEKYFSMICAAQVEVNFSQRGMLEDFDDGTSNYYSRQINYIEIPLFAHLSWGKEKKGFQFFQKFMKDNGILDELEALEIKEGDTVRMYGLQFDYYK